MSIESNPNKQNIDEQEIIKFNTIASKWWDPESEFKPLHRINPVRVEYILRRSAGIFGKNVLDVGCGGGILSESLARAGAAVTAIDMGVDALEVARLHAETEGLSINYQLSTVEEHAKLYPQHYDVITCMEMLEHVPTPSSVVLACANLLKPGGHLFFSTINRNIKAWLFAVVAGEYILNMVPKGTHDARRFLRPSEILSWLDNTNLQGKEIVGIHYDLLSDHFSLSKNIDVNYIMHTQS